MAFDLAKVDPQSGDTPDPAFRRETTAPRVSTDRPALEVNQKITPPVATTNAEALAKILGVAVDTATAGAEQLKTNANNKDAATAALDFSTGTQNSQMFAKSHAYRDAWQLQGAKALSITVGDEAAQKVTDRLNDSDHPATIDDIDHVIEGVFQNHIMGPDGKPKNFGTVAAKMTLVNALNEVKANLMPAASEAIRKQTDTRFLSTWADNAKIEYNRGAPIGAPIAVDPLAPLPDALTPKPAHGAVSVAPTKMVEPFSGFTAMKPNSVMGAARQGGSVHNGEDYPIPSGTPLLAPTTGKVIASFSNARGGNQVRVQMADGAIVGYAHLSQRNVSVGDPVQAGQAVGISGATGDATGPHVHMTVEVGGKKVSPKSYFSGAVGHSGLASAPAPSDANTVALLTAPPSQVPSNLAPFQFEHAMSQLPPSIDKGEAKRFLLQNVINTAQERSDIGILAGLEDSHRPDGTPSFSPTEQETIIKAREAVGDKARIDASQAQSELWKKNGEALLTALVSNKPPSDDFIASAAQSGQIDPTTAYTLISHNRAARKEEAAQAKAEARMADAEANSTYDTFVAGEAARRSVGDLSGDSANTLFNSGKLGPPGKKALGRYNQLLAAERQGETRNRENPLYGQYMGQLRMKYGQRAGDPFLAPQFTGPTSSSTNYFGMLSLYKLKVSKGMDPEEAYLETITKFAPPSDAATARKQLIKELQAKKATGQ